MQYHYSSVPQLQPLYNYRWSQDRVINYIQLFMWMYLLIHAVNPKLYKLIYVDKKGPRYHVSEFIFKPSVE